MICGGYSNEIQHDDESLEIYNLIKDDVKYKVIRVISYKKQIVNGINYLLKILIEDEKFLFVKVYKNFENNIELLEQNIKDDFF